MKVVAYVGGLFFLAAMVREDIKEKKISLYKILLFGAGAVIYRIAISVFLWPELLGSLLPGVFLLLTGAVSGEGIGYGDGLAVVVLGLWTGGTFALLTVCTGILLAGGCGMLCWIMRKKKTIPFIPFLLAGMEVMLLYV